MSHGVLHVSLPGLACVTLICVLSEVFVSIVSTLDVLSAPAPLGLHSLMAALSSAPTPDEWLEGVEALGSELASRARALRESGTWSHAGVHVPISFAGAHGKFPGKFPETRIGTD